MWNLWESLGIYGVSAGIFGGRIVADVTDEDRRVVTTEGDDPTGKEELSRGTGASVRSDQKALAAKYSA